MELICPRANVLDLSEAKIWSKKLQQIQTNIRRILSLAAKYGIDVSPARKKNESLADSAAENN
jgi:hypothetical protein